MTRTGVRRPTPFDDAESAGPSRRTVLKAGAWAAPVIAIATAVPAASASIIQKLRFTNFSVWFLWGSGGDRTGIAGNTTVMLDGDTEAIAGPPVTLVVTVPADGMSAFAEVEAGTTGWSSPDPGEVAGGSIRYTFIWAGSLIVNGATSQLRFRLPAAAEVDLVPPIAWSAVAMGPPAESIGAAGELQQYLRPTADPADLQIAPGALSGDGTALSWTGASIAYVGVGSAVVPYVVELRGPNGVHATLTEPEAEIANGSPVSLELEYHGPFAPGDYWISLSVVAETGVIEDTTATVTL